MKKMGETVPRVFVDRRMNKHELSNQKEGLPEIMSGTRVITGMPRSITIYSVDCHLIGETLQHNQP